MMSFLNRRAVAGLAVALLLGLLLPVWGDDDKPANKMPADLDLVPHDALWFATVRVADLIENRDFKKILPLLSPGGETKVLRLEKDFGLKSDSIERVTIVSRRIQSAPLWIVHTTKAYDKDAFLKGLGDTTETKVHGKVIVMSTTRARTGLTSAVWMPDDRTIVHGTPEALVPYLAAVANPGKEHPFAKELQVASGKHSVVLAMLPSMVFRSIDAESRLMRQRWEKKSRPILKESKDKVSPPTIKESPPAPIKDTGFKGAPRSAFQNRLSREQPAFDLTSIKEEPLKLRPIEEIFASATREPDLIALQVMKPAVEARRALLTIDLGDGIDVKATAEFDKEDQVKDAEVIARMGLYLLREMVPALLQKEMRIDLKAKGLARLVKQFKDTVRASEVKRDGKTLEFTSKAKIDLIPLVKYIAEIAPIRTDENNLKQIGIAFHAYHDIMGYLPQAGLCDATGKPLLSWRVTILPYIEQDNLYRQFKLDEAWDSPHNKKLLSKMPKIYAPPTGKADEPNVTFYQVLTGPNTLYPQQSTRQGIRSISDGTSNTLLVVEASKAVPWTKPADIVIPAKGKLPKFGGQFEKFFNAAFCDGSVRPIRRDFDPVILRAAITPAGGEVFDDRKLKP